MVTTLQPIDFGEARSLDLGRDTYNLLNLKVTFEFFVLHNMISIPQPETRSVFLCIDPVRKCVCVCVCVCVFLFNVRVRVACKAT